MKILDRSIVVGLFFIAFLMPWQTAYIIQQPIVGTIGTVSITLADILILFIAVMFLFRACRRFMQEGIRTRLTGWSRCLRTPSVALCIAFAVYVFLSMMWSGQKLLAFAGILRLLEGFIVCALIIRYRVYGNSIVVGIVLAAVVQSMFALGQFALQESPSSSWFGLAYHSSRQLGDAVVEVGDQRWLRAYGAFPHPNVLAAFLSFGLFSCLSLMRRALSKKVVWLLLGAWSCMLAGLFFTFSREVWIGTAIGFGVATYYCRKYQWRGTGISPSVMACVIAFFCIASLSIIYWEPLAGRLGLGGQSRLERKSISERVQSYKDGWSLIRTSPLIGTGMLQSSYALYRLDETNHSVRPAYAYQPPHNVFFLILTELGAIGAFLFACSIIALLIRFRRQSNAYNPLFAGTMMMIAVAGMFDHFFWTLQSGVLIVWMALALLHCPDTFSPPLDRKSLFS